jgi:hypothetical protein
VITTPSDQRSLAQVEDVAQPVGCDLPALCQRGHDRRVRPALDQPVVDRHLQLDVDDLEGVARVDAPWQHRHRHAQCRRRPLGRPRRLPERERPPVGLVGLAEPKRRVQRQCQLEQHQGHLMALAAALEQLEKCTIVVDGLVERVGEPGAIARAGEVDDRALLVACCQPVMGEQPRRVVAAGRLLAFEPFGGQPV